jgi:hypothetical protein
MVLPIFGKRDFIFWMSLSGVIYLKLAGTAESLLEITFGDLKR